MGTYKLVTDNKNTFFTNNKLTIGTAAPTSGTHSAGDLVISSSANSTAFGWVCTAAGTPGTWKVLKSGSDVTLSSLGAAASSHTHNYAGSSSAGGAATSANKVNTNLIIKLNGGSTEGTNLFTFNGSTAKTVNITPSGIGAAVSDHTHSYLPLSGGTVTGDLVINGDLTTTQTYNGETGYEDTPLGISYSSIDGTETEGATSTYSTIFTVNKSSNRQFQFNLNNSGTIFAFRSAHVNNTNGTGTGWSVWRKIYHEGNKPTYSDVGAAAASHTHNYAASTSAGGGASGVVVSNDTSNKLYLTGVTATTANSGTVRTSTPYMAGGTITATTFSGALSGNATTATTLKNARDITIGNKTNSFNGSAAISFTLSDIGAAAASHTHSYLPLTGGELSGRLSAWGHLSLPTSGGMWITGMDITKPSIGVTTQQTSGSYHPVLGVMTYSGNYVNLGGINNDFGFYGYTAGRTENGIDWQFAFDTANKVLNTDLDINAAANTGYFGALVLNNNNSLYGWGTGGTTPYNICGVDSNNYLYLGWNAETRTLHRNPTYLHNTYMVMNRTESGFSTVFDMYTDPNRLEIFWGDGNGDNWSWSNKFYFDVNGQFYASKQVSIGGHRITPYSDYGVSIINPAGSEFSGLEVKELWIGPYTGATYKFVVSPSAPSSPSWGTVWVQNG